MFEKSLRLVKKNPAIAIVLIVAGSLLLLSHLEIIPNAEELLAVIEEKYEKYGVIALFFSTLFEGFLFVGIYYIGTIFILTAVIIAQGDLLMLLEILFAVWAALTLISVVNFTIGRYGILKMQPPQSYLEDGVSVRSFIYFLHPTLIAYLTYSLGSSGRPYRSLLGVSLGIFLAGAMYEIFVVILITFVPTALIFIIIPSLVLLVANYPKIADYFLRKTDIES